MTAGEKSRVPFGMDGFCAISYSLRI